MRGNFKKTLKQISFHIFSRLQDGRDDNDIRRTLTKMKYCGEGLDVDSDVKFYGHQYVEIGLQTKIRSGSRIQASDNYPLTGQKFNPKLKIGERCFIEFGVHISACHFIDIGNDVTIASGAYIADHQHRHDDPAKPVIWQPITEGGRIVIGDGSFIGTGACVFSNVVLGNHVVVGANSVVTKDIPSFCVVAGAPAHILRHFDFDQEIWVLGPPDVEQSDDNNGATS